MKVLLINSVCGIKSTGRICTDLAVELERRGHVVKIAYGREAVPKAFERFAVRIGSELGVKLHGAGARLFDSAGFGSKKDTVKFIEWVKSFDPDVIHLHNIHGYYINIEILFNYLKVCGKKIFWTLHDCWAFTGHCAYFEAAGCEKWREGCGGCPQKRSYPASFSDMSEKNFEKKRGLFRGVPSMTLFTPSKWLADLVKQSFLSEYPVKVVNNGIDTSVFKPRESAFRKNRGIEVRFVILGVAAIWDSRKGFADFLKLNGRIDGSTMVMVGLSREQLGEIPKDIIGIERTDSAAGLAEIYSAADVLFNPTYEDNYPTVNLEAIACSTPVVTYNAGGAPETVGENGFVVPKGDLDAAVDAIKKIRAEGFRARGGAESKEAFVNRCLEFYLK